MDQQIKHSTYIALLNILGQILESLDVTNIYIGLFYLSKAFDTTDHCILLQKLQVYGIRGYVLEGLSRYLTDNAQCVCRDDICSTSLQIKCGIPQGFILGSVIMIIIIVIYIYIYILIILLSHHIYFSLLCFCG